MATQTLTRRQSEASVTPPEPIEPLAGGNLETTNPAHLDSIVDVAGDAACLHEVARA